MGFRPMIETVNIHSGIDWSSKRLKRSVNRFLADIRVKAISGCRFVRVRGISKCTFKTPRKIPSTRWGSGLRARDRPPMKNLAKSLLRSNLVVRTRALKCRVAARSSRAKSRRTTKREHYPYTAPLRRLRKPLCLPRERRTRQRSLLRNASLKFFHNSADARRSFCT